MDDELYLGEGSDDPEGSRAFSQEELWTFSGPDTTMTTMAGNAVPENRPNPATTSTPGVISQGNVDQATLAEVSKPAVVYSFSNFNQQ
jgi:hypothetical protein